jgi:hypothetical protein
MSVDHVYKVWKKTTEISIHQAYIVLFYFKHRPTNWSRDYLDGMVGHWPHIRCHAVAARM